MLRIEFRKGYKGELVRLLQSDVMSEMRRGDEGEELARRRTLAFYLPEVRLGVRIFGRREEKGSVGALGSYHLPRLSMFDIFLWKSGSSNASANCSENVPTIFLGVSI